MLKIHDRFKCVACGGLAPLPCFQIFKDSVPLFKCCSRCIGLLPNIMMENGIHIDLICLN